MVTLVVSVLTFKLSVFRFFDGSSERGGRSALVTFGSLRGSIFSGLMRCSLPVPAVRVNDGR